MNIIISFAGLETSQSGTPYALRHLAGSTILGHILVQLLDISFKKLILILDSGEEQVQGWIRRNIPDLTLQTLLVVDSNDPITALYNRKSVLDSEPLLFISGNYITEVNYSDLISSAADASCLLQSEQDSIPAEELKIDEAGFIALEGDYAVRWAGSCWFRQGTDLFLALDTAQDQRYDCLGPTLFNMIGQGLRISTRRVVYCLDTRSVESMLYANALLLRLNYGTQDAIERSYAEDFTVLPPVFLHETAVIENSVIGPFVNLEANASVRNSIIRNTLIGKGTQISDAILDKSLIGDNAVIAGHSSTLIAGDGAKIKIRNK